MYYTVPIRDNRGVMGCFADFRALSLGAAREKRKYVPLQITTHNDGLSRKQFDNVMSLIEGLPHNTFFKNRVEAIKAAEANTVLIPFDATALEAHMMMAPFRLFIERPDSMTVFEAGKDTSVIGAFILANCMYSYDTWNNRWTVQAGYHQSCLSGLNLFLLHHYVPSSQHSQLRKILALTPKLRHLLEPAPANKRMGNGGYVLPKIILPRQYDDRSLSDVLTPIVARAMQLEPTNMTTTFSSTTIDQVPALAGIIGEWYDAVVNHYTRENTP